MANPTIKTIAKEAGVSVATVSKALNNMPDISESTKAHVCAVAKKQGYTLNTNARELAMGSSHSVGVLLPDITYPGCAKFTQGLHTRLSAAGCALYLNESGGNRQTETTQTLAMLQKRVGVLVLFTEGAEAEHVAQTVREQIPIIYVGGRVNSALSCTVACNNAAGGRLAARHLMRAGHRSCVIFTPALPGVSHLERAGGFLEYMNLHAGKAEIRQGPADMADEDAGEALARQLSLEKNRNTAVYATGDALALGALAGFAKENVLVPGEISLIGYGDTPAAGLKLANLTTLRLPFAEMGIHAGDMAVSWMRGEAPPLSHILLEPELVARGTVQKI